MTFLNEINGYDVKLPKESSIKKIGLFLGGSMDTFEKVGIAIKNRIDELRRFEDCIAEREAHLKSMLTNAMLYKYSAVHTAIQNIKSESVALEGSLEQNKESLQELKKHLQGSPHNRQDLKKNQLLKQLKEAKEGLTRYDLELLRLQHQLDEVDRSLTKSDIDIRMRKAAKKE